MWFLSAALRSAAFVSTGFSIVFSAIGSSPSETP
jgi:hypothetical protein